LILSDADVVPDEQERPDLEPHQFGEDRSETAETAGSRATRDRPIDKGVRWGWGLSAQNLLLGANR
jgi:hypothetical protein